MENNWEHNFFKVKKLFVCALCCWNLFFEFSISCWYIWNWFFLPKDYVFVVFVGILEKNKVVLIYRKTLFSLFVLPLLFFSSFVDSCLFCDCSDMDIGRGSSVASSRLTSCLVISCHFFSTVFFTISLFMIRFVCFSFSFSVSFSFPFLNSCFPFFFVTCLSSPSFQKPFLFFFFLVWISPSFLFCYESFLFSTSPFSFVWTTFQNLLLPMCIFF